MHKHKVDRPEDCLRIVAQVNKLGYDCTLMEAEEMWNKYSDKVEAGWIGLPDTEEDLAEILKLELTPPGDNL